MPSFYQAGLQPSHLSNLTPEYASKYTYNAYGDIHDQQHGYDAYGGVGCQDLSSLSSEPYDPYRAVAPPSATIFPPSNVFNNNPAANSFVNAPTYRPMRLDHHHRSSRGDDVHHRRHGNTVAQHQPKEEQVVGGVSAKLDYEMDVMTDFVSEMTAGMYDLYISRICVADIDFLQSIKPGLKPPPNFRKWVLHVLNATRLPSATILTSLHYLTLRVRDLSAKGEFSPTEHGLYQLLTVALILGSKFLDDNTFQNKSWAEVSSIKVTELNRDEREWLAAFDHRLHYHSNAPDGFDYWQKRWNSFKARALATPSALHPLDTNIQRHRSTRQSVVRQTASPAAYPTQYAKPVARNLMDSGSDSQYSTPAYSPFDPWFTQRSASDRSPSTAPHTGPSTPEYYGNSSLWAKEPYSQRSQFNYPMSQQPVTYQTPYNMPYGHQYGWNGHGNGCDCAYCPRQVPHYSYMLPARYGATVAA